jgi:leukotriene-A4 hydrolase
MRASRFPVLLFALGLFAAGLILATGPVAAAAPAAVEAEPALAGRGIDEHSYSQPQIVRIRDLALSLSIDFDTRTLKGSADYSLEWADPAARELVLDTRELQIDKVLGRRGDTGWRSLDFSLDAPDAVFGSALRIRMSRQYDVVRVRYRTAQTASGLQWLEPAMTAGGKAPFLFSQSQAIHARSWVPLQDTPSVRYTYSAVVRTPPNLVALMSADNPVNPVRNGRYVFRMSQPIPSYLMAIAVGDLEFAPISARSGVWAEPATLAAAVAEFADTERMIEATEALYGPYRWERYDLLILPPSFPFGGMENPRLSFITPTVIVGDKSLVSLIAHELAHSWSGNLVTNSSWKDIWLNEGFTSYVENRIVESLYGIERAQMEMVIEQASLRRELADLAAADQLLVLPPLTGRDPDDALTPVAYIKGAWFLSFLEQRFGREEFDAFLRGYFDRFAFQAIDSSQFVAHLRETLLVEQPNAISEPELDAWLFEPGVPEFAVAATSQRFAAVDLARTAFLQQQTAAADLQTAEWTTQEWLYFLEGLPPALEGTVLVALDEAFRFTGTSNGEIAMRWYPLAERSGYFEARPAMADFLKRIGRRKLIMPVYTALAASPEGLEFARAVFVEARPGYHPITAASVAAALQ